jgi:hypothetical protein
MVAMYMSERNDRRRPRPNPIPNHLPPPQKYITTDYFGNEIPKVNQPGQFAHLTGAPTPIIIDDGAPVCHVENSIELRQAIIVCMSAYV